MDEPALPSLAQGIFKADLKDGSRGDRKGDPEAMQAKADRAYEESQASTTAFWSFDDLDDAGYTDLCDDEQLTTDAILAEVDALGLDREAIIEAVVMRAGDLTTKECHAVLKRLTDEAVSRYRSQAGQADASPAREGSEGDGGNAQAPGRPGSDRANGSDEAVRPGD